MAADQNNSGHPGTVPGATRFFVGLEATVAVLVSVGLWLAADNVGPALVCFAICCTALSGVALTMPLGAYSFTKS